MAQLPVTGSRRARDVTDAGIANARLAAQRLAVPAAIDPAALVAWLGAVQSQDYPLGRWSIAQRLARTSGDINAAIADGSILRTHVLRPTWHFVARDDLRWMQELTAPRVLALLKQNDRRNGVDAGLVERGMKTIEAAIARDGHLTRREAGVALGRAGIRTDAWLLGDLLMHAELRAIVCSGVPRDRHQTYALVDERAPKASSLTRDEALSTLARRYFYSHGPATARDFQWWSGLSATDVARSLDILGRALERVPSDDRAYIFPATQVVARSKARTAHVLQPFDEIVVAYSESRAVVDASGAVRGAGTSGAALLMRGVIYNGQLIARWRVTAARGSRAIALEPLRRLSSVERDAAAAAASRFQHFYFA